MKKIIIIFSILFVSFNLYAATSSDVFLTNGTLVRKVIFTSDDEEFELLQSMELTFGVDKKLKSKKLFFNEKYTQEKDILSQEEILDNNGKIIQYIITFSETYLSISGLKKTIETVDANDIILTMEYYTKDHFLFKENYQNRHIQFPFYKLSYLNNVMFEEYIEDPDHINYGFSGKYISATSIITFIDQPVSLNKNDRDFIAMYFKSRGTEQYTSLFNSKVLVNEDGKSYYVILEDNVLLKTIANKKAAISHYYGTRDKEFMILCVGLNYLD